MINASDIVAGASIIAVGFIGGLVKVIYNGQESKIKDIKVVDEKQWETITVMGNDIATIKNDVAWIKSAIEKMEEEK